MNKYEFTPNAKFFIPKDGGPFISFRNETLNQKYIVFIDEKNHKPQHGFLYENGNVQLAEVWMFNDPDSLWSEISMKKAFAMLNIRTGDHVDRHTKQQTKRFFMWGKDAPFISAQNGKKYVVVLGDEFESGFLYEDGSFVVGSHSDYMYFLHQLWNWVEVNEQSAMASLKYTFSELDVAFDRIDASKKLDAIEHLQEKMTKVAAKRNQSPMLYRYLRYFDHSGVCGAGGVTFGIKIDYTTNHLTIYLAICNVDTTFDKAQGRLIVAQRERDKLAFKCRYDEDVSLIDNVMNSIADNKCFIPFDVPDSDYVIRLIKKVEKAVDAGAWYE